MGWVDKALRGWLGGTAEEGLEGWRGRVVEGLGVGVGVGADAGCDGVVVADICLLRPLAG